MAVAQKMFLPSTRPIKSVVVGLVRVSTADQAKDDRGGIPRQRESVRRTIERHNLDCLQIYELTDCSGTQVLKSPIIQEILQLVSSRVVSGLVVADLDRLFRPDQPTDYAILQAFKDTGAAIYSGETVYNLEQRDSALFANIRSAISGWELQMMKDRYNGAKEAKRRQGKCPTNELTLPIGVSFDRKQQKFYYNDRISKVVEVFRLYDEEGVHNYCEIARRTGLFNVTVRNMLRNPLYTGWRVIDQKRGDRTVSRTGKTYRKKTKRPDGEVIKVRVIETPAITQECFDRVQRSMDEVKFNHHANRKRDEVFNLGTGLGRCAYCGEPLYCSSGKRTGKSRQGYYSCKANYYSFRERLGGCKQPHVRQQDMDNLIEAFAERTLSDANTLTALVAGSLQRTSEVITPFPRAEAGTRLEALKKREKRLVDAYENGAITVDELRARREEVRREAAAIAKESEAQTRKQPQLELESFVRLVVRGALRLKRLNDRREKKAIILGLFSEVYVKDRSITAFKFRSDVPLAGLVSPAAVDVPIQLEPPFLVVPVAEPVPPGHKRCSCCDTVQPTTSYFPNKGQCKPCIKVKASAAHQRRKTHGPL